MKLSELLYALKRLGVEEAEDMDKTPIKQILVSRGVMTVYTAALDENGKQYATHDDEIALNRKTYKIEDDL